MGRIGSSCALQTKAEAEAATRIVQWLGLESHRDAVKDWDSLKALHHVLRRSDPMTPVLDAGTSKSSAILRWLSKLGFKKLHGCNLKNMDLSHLKGIEFTRQDMTRTNYPDAFFGAVTCLSVIEHIEPVEPFFAEMRRIVGAGGSLLLSTDYWSDPIDCTGIYPYGAEMPPMKVFTPEGMEELCRLAAKHGFSLVSPWDPRTRSRAIRWERVGREYTFAFLAMEREA